MSIIHLLPNNPGPRLDIEVKTILADEIQLTVGANAGDVLVSDGSGNASWQPSSTLLPQPLGPADDPTFNSVTLSSMSANALVRTDASKKLVSQVLTDGQLVIGSTGLAPASASLAAGTNIVVTPGAGSLSVATSLTPSYTDVTSTSLTANTIVLADGSKKLVSQALTDGQLLIGSTGLAPVATNLIAGTNIDIVNAAGSITINNTANKQLSITGTSATVIPDTVATAIDFTVTTAIYDPNGFQTSPQDFKVPVGLAGVYFVNAFARFDDNVAGTRGLRFYVNGGSDPNNESYQPPDNSGRGCVNTCINLNLVDGDVVQLIAFQDSGGPLTMKYATLRMQLLTF